MSNERPHSMKDAVRRLEESTNGKGSAAAQHLTEDFEALRKAVENLKNDLSEMASQSFKDTYSKAKDLGQRAEKTVEEHPWWALGILGLVAFLIGFLLGRKD